LNSALDFAIARLPKNIETAAIAYEEIGEERISIISRSDHPLSRKRCVSVDEMRAYPWVMQPRGAPLRSCIERLFLSHKVKLPDSIIETASVLMTMALVENTTSLAVIADPVAVLYSSPDHFASVSISTPLSLEPFGLLHLRDRNLSPAVKILQEQVRTLASNRIKKRSARKS
jgi:DNA-binding transcriptional LysR family regulator